MIAWMLSEESFRNCFHILCVTAAVSLSTYFIYTYSLNEDLCKVDYKSYFEDVEDKYPVLSACFKTFVINESIDLQSDKTTKSKYTDFLIGNFFDDNLMKLNFTAVTVNVIDSVDSQRIVYRNESKKNFESPKKALTEGFVGTFSEYLYKCYSLEVPSNREIEAFEINLKNNVFSNNTRDSFGGMISFLHLKNQFLDSSETLKFSWPKRTKHGGFAMRFKIVGVEVIKRRSNGRKSCYGDWKNYDNYVLLEHLKNVGCRVPYLQTSNPFPLCNSKEKLKESQFPLTPSNSEILPPCKAMEKVYYDYVEEDLDGIKEDVFTISVWYPDKKFKEITQTR